MFDNQYSAGDLEKYTTNKINNLTIEENMNPFHIANFSYKVNLNKTKRNGNKNEIK